MSIEIRVPSVGESISEVFIGEWYVKEGEWVGADDNVVGLETDKATFDVPAPEMSPCNPQTVPMPNTWPIS